MEQSKKEKVEEQYTGFDLILKDIIDNILERLPFKDLDRFRCVSKSWYNTIIPRVLKNRKTHSSKLIVPFPGGIQIVDYEAPPSSNVQDFTLPLKGSEPESKLSPWVLSSCNGLLCIIFPESSKTLLWNPLTKEYKEINVNCRVIGFGYENGCREYKIVAMFDYCKLKVYSLHKNSWRDLEIKSDFCNLHRLGFGNIGTQVNGFMYWPMSHGCYPNEVHLILRFDLADEKFSLVQPPCDVDHKSNLKLMVFEGNKLCAYQKNHSKETIEMWVLKKEKDDDGDLKWTELMSIPKWKRKFLAPLCFGRIDEVLLYMTKNGFFFPHHLRIDWLCAYNLNEESFRWFRMSRIEGMHDVLPEYEETVSFTSSMGQG